MLKFFVVFGAVALCAAITQEQIDELKNQCRTEVIDLNNREIPLAIRLAFHDCVGPEGCDGCLDLNNPDNAGLATVFRRISGHYFWMVPEDVKEEYTRADHVALCGIAAAEKGFENGGYDGSKQFSFKVGRQTNNICTGTNTGLFPNGNFDFMEVMDFFEEEFGLDERQSVVLMGAHSLGAANAANSGWMGPWTANPNNLDNEYYQVVEEAVDEKWHLQDQGDHHYHWRRRAPREPEMMLHADMVIRKNITIDDTGLTNCDTDVSLCPDSPTSPIVAELAEDNNQFVEEFIDVFTIMIENVGTTGNTLIPAEDVKKRDSNLVRLLRILEDKQKADKQPKQRRLETPLKH